MTMTIEEKFREGILWVLEELQKEQLASGGNSVRFFFLQDENTPSIRDQKRVIKWLHHRVGAIDSFTDILEQPSILTFYPLYKRATIGYKVEIDLPAFTTLTEIYGNKENGKSAEALRKEAERLGKAKQLQTEKEYKPEATKNPFLDKENRTIIFLDKSSPIPVNAINQWVLCEALFAKPAGDWVKENDVVHSFIRGDNKQSFYDACNALNKRTEKDLGIKDLVEYQTSMARINTAAIEKLNQSDK